MTTTPPQSPHDPYAAQPGAGGGYGPPPEQFPQYAQQTPHADQYHAPQQPQYDQGQNYAQPGQYQPPAQPGQPVQPGQPQYDQPHGQQQFGQSFPQQAPQGMPAYQQGAIQCRFCGGMPAVKATVRGHQGLLIVMRFLKLEGPFCRTCGIATVRNMTAKSLIQGWWGVGSSIINPITMLINIPTRLKFKNLPEPMPGAPGQPMDMGKPLYQRAAAVGFLGFLVPILFIVLIVIGNMSSPSSAAVGDCVHNAGTVSSPNVKVVGCTSSDADYKVVGKLSNTTNTDQCEQFEGYTVAYTEEGSRSSGYTLCLAPN